MDIVISPGPDGTRWASTKGLGALGQQDFAVTMCWDEDNWRDNATRDVLEFLGSYAEVQPRRIHAGETMRYGWTSLVFRESAPDDIGLKASRLIIGEIADPLHDAEPEYIEGAQRAIILYMLQGYTAHRLGAEIRPVDCPHRSMYATVCRHVRPGANMPFVMSRRPMPEDGQSPEEELYDSGWQITCTDPGHAHGVGNAMAHGHLSHFVESDMYTFPYLGLPEGWSVAFENRRATVFRPNDPEAYLDPAEPFTGIK